MFALVLVKLLLGLLQHKWLQTFSSQGVHQRFVNKLYSSCTSTWKTAAHNTAKKQDIVEG